MPPRATDGPPGRRRVALGFRLACRFPNQPDAGPRHAGPSMEEGETHKRFLVNEKMLNMPPPPPVSF